MATWKKVIVSGSSAHLTGITSSVLTANNILQAGTGGAIQNSGITLSGNTLALGANSITSTGANSVLTGSFAGTFSGSLTVNLQDLTAGAGIEDFTYDGNSAQTVQAAVTASSGDFLYWDTSGLKSKFTGSGGLSYDNLNDRISVSKALAPSSNETINIGVSATNRFNQVYVRDIFARSVDLSLGLTVSGSTTLGDASADAVTVNAQTVTLQNPLAVGALSSTMLVLTSSNRVATQTLGSGIATFLNSPSSANLAAAVTDETGTGTLVFSASPTFTGTVVAANISASGNISGSTLHITGNETIGGTSTIAGRLTANGAITTTNITASGNISSSAGLIGATLTTSGNGTIGGTLNVTSTTTLTGALTVNSSISASGNISGSTLRIVGNESIGGNSAIGGTLDVTGTTTLAGNLLANGNTTLGNATGDTLIISGSSISVPSIGAGTTDTVIIRTATNELATRTIDNRVWGTTLLDGNLTTNRVPFASDANTLTDDAGLTYNSGTDTLTVGTSTFGTNVVVAGNLTVNGDTTIIDTTNLSVEDKFIILAHGSGSISPIQEGGIIIEGSTADSGQAFVFNSGSSAGVTGRWGVAANVHATSSDVTPTDYMVSANTAAGAPSSAPTYGGTNGGYGNIYVNSSDESIWIFS